MTKVYIYHDADHQDVEVFDSMKKAKAYTKEQWGKPKWEKYSGEDLHDLNSDYVCIYVREIK